MPVGQLRNGFNTAAFYKDPWGLVHLKGLVAADDFGAGQCDFDQTSATELVIFFLPEGYWPAAREVHATLAGNSLARVNVSHTDGGVRLEGAMPGSGQAEDYLSLDGITFRAAG